MNCPVVTLSSPVVFWVPRPLEVEVTVPSSSVAKKLSEWIADEIDRLQKWQREVLKLERNDGNVVEMPRREDRSEESWQRERCD